LRRNHNDEETGRRCCGTNQIGTNLTLIQTNIAELSNTLATLNGTISETNKLIKVLEKDLADSQKQLGIGSLAAGRSASPRNTRPLLCDS